MKTIHEQIENVDVYLIDQILKNRYNPNDLILDAGCGSGRNLKWFLQNNFNCIAVDVNAEAITLAKENYPKNHSVFSIADLANLPFKNSYFNHIICSAVLHFSESETHFKQQFSELVRVLKPNGSIFIRMTTNVGVEATAKPIGKGVYYLKDETNRFLLKKDLLNKLIKQYNLELLEPFKTTVVEDLRSMATIVLTKL